MWKYFKKLIYPVEEEKKDHTWISGVLFFRDEGKAVIDRAFIITENIKNYVFYCDLRNFTIINGDLFYLYPTHMKKISFDHVYLHLKIGKSPYPLPLDNPSYWYHFFNSPNNKVFQSLTLNKDMIRIIQEDYQKDSQNKIDISDIDHPFFLKRQAYDKNSVLFTGLKTCFFSF